MSTGSIIAGVLAGLVVTVLVTFLWPRSRNRHLGAVLAALLGVAAAVVVMTQIRI
ncbi:MAG: hypothetical protein LOD90_03850 [Symbiobacteriaceae bacterium]